jgi:hypothetical protein
MPPLPSPLKCVLHACLRASLIPRVLHVHWGQHRGSSRPLNRRSCAASRPSSTSSIAPHAQAHWRLHAQCTELTRQGTGSCGEGSLRGRGLARRRFTGRRRSTRTSEPGTLLRSRRWTTYALIAIACVCGMLAWMRRLACMPSAAADRGCGHACSLVSFTHFSRNICALVRTRI